MTNNSIGPGSNAKATDSSGTTSGNTWKDLRPSICEIARQTKNLQSILIRIVDEISDNRKEALKSFAITNRISVEKVEDFVNNTAALGGKSTLRRLAQQLSHTEPRLTAITQTIIQLKERVPSHLGPVYLTSPEAIDIWLSLMSKFEDKGYDKSVIREFCHRTQNIILAAVRSTPARKNMVEFEKNLPTILRELNAIKWEEIKPVNKPKVPVIENSRNHPVTTTPVVTAGEPEVSKRSQRLAAYDTNSADAVQLKRLVDECIEQYGTLANVIRECAKRKIKIGATALREAYNHGVISKAAKQFMAEAPNKLLSKTPSKEVVAETQSVPVVQESAPLTADNFVPHTRKVAEEFDFTATLRAHLLATCDFLEVAVQAPLDQREKIISANREVLDRVKNGIDALQAEEPLPFLTMLIGNSEIKRERGSRNR
jgi:hypothetical protein